MRDQAKVMIKKLYLVKREVYASNIKQAMINRGKIYEISETEKEKEVKKVLGFKTKQNGGNEKS